MGPTGAKKGSRNGPPKSGERGVGEGSKRAAKRGFPDLPTEEVGALRRPIREVRRLRWIASPSAGGCTRRAHRREQDRPGVSAERGGSLRNARSPRVPHAAPRGFIRWRNLGILSSDAPFGASVESVRRLPRAGTRIRLVLSPSREIPVGSPGSFVGHAAAASDLTAVSLRPNSLASNLESGVPLCEPMATVSVGTIHHLSPILMRPKTASMLSLPVRERGGHGRRETSMTVVSAMTKTRSCGAGETSAPPVNSPKEGRTAPCAPNQKHGSRCR